MKRATLFSLVCGLFAAIFITSCTPMGPLPSSDRQAGVAPPSYTPSPEERPGLATGWGEEKTSTMEGSHFVRSSSRPSGMDTLYYNDKDGIKAMSGNAYKVEGLQTAAGGMVEWGIKGSLGYLSTYKDYNNRQRFVQGDKEQTYSIVIKNRCKSALEIVASVDGLDVMDGKSASLSKRGYIVKPGKAVEIKGFRTSYDKVAAFKFSSVSHSYANLRHGNTRNVGVIGIAVFTEKGVNPWTWMPDETERRNTAQPFSTAP